MPCDSLNLDEPLSPPRDEYTDPALERMNIEVAKLLGWSVEQRTANDPQPRLVSCDSSGS